MRASYPQDLLFCEKNRVVLFSFTGGRMVKVKRFLGNTNTLEVHDTQNEHTSCQLSEIELEHRAWYDSLDEAKRGRPFDNCAWCLSGSTR